MAKENLNLFRDIKDPNLFELADHFIGGGVGATAIANWVETNGGAGTNTRVSAVVNHPGILHIVTNNIDQNSKRLHLGNTASDPVFTPANFDRFRYVLRIPTITSVIVRVGLMQDVSSIAAGGTAGAYFEFDPATSANWRMVVRQASTSSSANAVAVTANNWYLLEAIHQTSGHWEFFINGTSRTVSSSNEPTTDCNFGAMVTPNAIGASRTLDLDYCYVRSTLGQLWT